MTFDEFVGEVKKVRCEEIRVTEADYLELVVAQKSLDILTPVLKGYFGAPFKSAGEKPSREAADHSAPYGGIQLNQTLYYHQGDRGPELALLWPWGAGTPVTVKIVRK